MFRSVRAICSMRAFLPRVDWSMRSWAQLDIDWAQLRIDQSTLGKSSRIEQIARTDLNMAPLTPARTQYLTEGQQ